MLRTCLLVIALVAACGSDAVRHIADAPPSAGSDATAPPIDAAPNAVTLSVALGGVGEAGVTVYFQSADSTLLTTVMTDATGTATGSVGEGGFVTAVNPLPGSSTTANPDELITWADVRPGDHLVFDEAGAPITVNFIIPQVTNGATYGVFTSCGSRTALTPTVSAGPPPPITAAIALTGCTGPQDVLVVAFDGNTQALASFFVADQTFGDNGTADYHMQTYTAAIARTYTWNDDNDVASLAMVDQLASAKGTLFSSASLTAAGTAPSITRKAFAFGTLTDVVASTLTVGMTRHALDEWGQPATYATDWGAHRLPDFTSGLAYDATTAQATWTSTGGAATPNLSLVAISATRPSDEHR
jgi:hypothetical protein